MNAVLRRRLEMAARVRDFLRAHRTEGVEGAALTRLEELVQRAEALAAQQRAGVLAVRGSIEQRAAVRRALQSTLLLYLSGVGAVAAEENAELGAQFQLPQHRVPNQAFVTLAQGMLARAMEHREVLVRRGLSETVLTDIAAALAQFELTLEVARAGRREHVGASADLRAVASAITRQVRLLDGLVRYRSGGDAELMSAWASARNVLGPVRLKVEPPVVKSAA